MTSFWMRSWSLIGIVDLEPGGSGILGRNGDEHHAILEREMSFEIMVSHCAFVVEREHDEAADVVEFGPTMGTNRFGQACEVPSHPIRRQDLVFLEDREDLRVDGIELVLSEANRPGRAGRGERLP